MSYKTCKYFRTLHSFLFATESHERCFYGEVLAVSLPKQLDVTHRLASHKTYCAKKKKECEHNGPEHRLNTGDKCPDRLRTAAQTHMHTHTHSVKQYILKSSEIHQRFRAFEKPFNDPSRDID